MSAACWPATMRARHQLSRRRACVNAGRGCVYRHYAGDANSAALLDHVGGDLAVSGPMLLRAKPRWETFEPAPKPMCRYAFVRELQMIRHMAATLAVAAAVPVFVGAQDTQAPLR